MASVPAGAVPMQDALPGDESMGDLAMRSAADPPAADGAMGASTATAFAPFRAQRARKDPYQKPRRRHGELDPDDDARSRSDPEDQSVISAVGSCRSANTGPGGRAGGLPSAP